MLLFVETRLGTFLGKEKAFYTLASMASSRRPEAISTYVAQLPAPQRPIAKAGFSSVLEQRSDWAYKELVALLKNIRSSGEDALAMPGSIYGAIGLCQFMPTNISHYGADGNGDGVVNLFTVPDAVASLANYLAQHGWNKAATRAQKQKVIKTYNRIDIYANTILGLAEAQGYVAGTVSLLRPNGGRVFVSSFTELYPSISPRRHGSGVSVGPVSRRAKLCSENENDVSTFRQAVEQGPHGSLAALLLLMSLLAPARAELVRCMPDQRYGITRKAFRGLDKASSREVNAAMVQAINTLPGISASRGRAASGPDSPFSGPMR